MGVNQNLKEAPVTDLSFKTLVQADANGDGLADFQLALQWAGNGSTAINPTQLDFVL